MWLVFNVFCIYLFLWPFVSHAEINEINRPTVGIIRWDAWNLINGQYDAISYYSHRAMSPEHFHYRLPFFAKINSDTNVTINGDTQEIMDEEILYAKFAGFDYWAFDTYCAFGPNCTTNSSYCVQYYKQTSNQYCPQNPAYGLNRYLSSQYVSLINFTFVLLGSSPCDDKFQESYIEFMIHPQFQTVLDGRPLLYLFQFDDEEAQLCGGGWHGSGQVFNNFRQKVINRGLKNPYMVLMDGDIERCKTNAAAIGFDAISSYGIGGGGTIEGSPFSDEVQRSEQWWNAAIQSGAKVVVTLPTGWDPRPRYEHPVPWVNQGPEHFLQPTAEELQNFFKNSIQLTCMNKNITEAQTIIVYAWNESSENGASLIPSIGNGTYYVRALSEILPMSC
ncbi:unnamed protein product [Rotaria sordida]|uniref:Uncharacterized protein n=1 Tax=Rotaria sordida TaxID=392033 RepID=A0A813XAM0_9BILA|nr:unnamed protein product [Rotaria sordida]